MHHGRYLLHRSRCYKQPEAILHKALLQLLVLALSVKLVFLLSI